MAIAQNDSRFDGALLRARRHSRFVAWMRRGLPLVAVLAVAGFGATAWLSNALPDGLSIEAVRVEGGDLVMTKPRLRGFDERDQPYSLDAERATQNVVNPDRFTLVDVLAEIPMPDGRRVTVLSDGAEYDRATDRLEIPESFTLIVDDGTVGTFANGSVNIADGTMSTTGKVEIENEQARIVADGLDVDEADGIATFTGNVRVTIEPGSPSAPPTLRGAVRIPAEGSDP